METTITVICGATATGKSAYAYKLAGQFPKSIIISADSRQFYKDLPIVSGQDDQTVLPKGCELYGQNFLSPSESSNISDFQKYSESIIKKALDENIPLFIVGGSGLYLKAVTTGIETTKIPPDNQFRQIADGLSVQELQKILKEENLDSYNSLNNSDINNPRRLIRKIEISRFNNQQEVIPAKAIIHQSSSSYSWIGLKKSPDNLLKSINSRVISRLENGAIQEVQNLLTKYPDTSLPIYSTLGVREIISFLKQEIDRETLINEWATKDYAYAKRQILWFSKQPNIVWYDNGI